MGKQQKPHLGCRIGTFPTSPRTSRGWGNRNHDNWQEVKQAELRVLEHKEHSRTHLDVFQTQHTTSKDVNVHMSAVLYCLPTWASPGKTLRQKPCLLKGQGDILTKCSSAAEGPSILGVLRRKCQDLPLKKATSRLQGFLKVKSWK